MQVYHDVAQYLIARQKIGMSKLDVRHIFDLCCACVIESNRLFQVAPDTYLRSNSEQVQLELLCDAIKLLGNDAQWISMGCTIWLLMVGTLLYLCVGYGWLWLGIALLVMYRINGPEIIWHKAYILARAFLQRAHVERAKITYNKLVKLMEKKEPGI